MNLDELRQPGGVVKCRSRQVQSDVVPATVQGLLPDLAELVVGLVRGLRAPDVRDFGSTLPPPPAKMCENRHHL
jgi:hypothetical protein